MKYFTYLLKCIPAVFLLLFIFAHAPSAFAACHCDPNSTTKYICDDSSYNGDCASGGATCVTLLTASTCVSKVNTPPPPAPASTAPAAAQTCHNGPCGGNGEGYCMEGPSCNTPTCNSGNELSGNICHAPAPAGGGSTNPCNVDSALACPANVCHWEGAIDNGSCKPGSVASTVGSSPCPLSNLSACNPSSCPTGSHSEDVLGNSYCIANASTGGKTCASYATNNATATCTSADSCNSLHGSLISTPDCGSGASTDATFCCVQNSGVSTPAGSTGTTCLKEDTPVGTYDECFKYDDNDFRIITFEKFANGNCGVKYTGRIVGVKENCTQEGKTCVQGQLTSSCNAKNSQASPNVDHICVADGHQNQAWKDVYNDCYSNSGGTASANYECSSCICNSGTQRAGKPWRGYGLGVATCNDASAPAGQGPVSVASRQTQAGTTTGGSGSAIAGGGGGGTAAGGNQGAGAPGGGTPSGSGGAPSTAGTAPIGGYCGDVTDCNKNNLNIKTTETLVCENHACAIRQNDHKDSDPVSNTNCNNGIDCTSGGIDGSKNAVCIGSGTDHPHAFCIATPSVDGTPCNRNEECSSGICQAVCKPKGAASAPAISSSGGASASAATAQVPDSGVTYCDSANNCGVYKGTTDGTNPKFCKTSYGQESCFGEPLSAMHKQNGSSGGSSSGSNPAQPAAASSQTCAQPYMSGNDCKCGNGSLCTSVCGGIATDCYRNAMTAAAPQTAASAATQSCQGQTYSQCVAIYNSTLNQNDGLGKCTWDKADQSGTDGCFPVYGNGKNNSCVYTPICPKGSACVSGQCNSGPSAGSGQQPVTGSNSGTTTTGSPTTTTAAQVIDCNTIAQPANRYKCADQGTFDTCNAQCTQDCQSGTLGRTPSNGDLCVANDPNGRYYHYCPSPNNQVYFQDYCPTGYCNAANNTCAQKPAATNAAAYQGAPAGGTIQNTGGAARSDSYYSNGGGATGTGGATGGQTQQLQCDTTQYAYKCVDDKNYYTYQLGPNASNTACEYHVSGGIRQCDNQCVTQGDQGYCQ